LTSQTKIITYSDVRILFARRKLTTWQNTWPNNHRRC